MRSYAIFFFKRTEKKKKTAIGMILDWIPCHKPGREEKKSQATTTTKKIERDLFKVVVVEYLNNHVIILSFLFAEDARRTSRRLCGCVRGLPEK